MNNYDERFAFGVQWLAYSGGRFALKKQPSSAGKTAKASINFRMDKNGKFTLDTKKALFVGFCFLLRF
ncbi:hypothetical protein ACH4U0_000027 [Pseudomonas aeruginosa]